jgi:hypothetical protein
MNRLNALNYSEVDMLHVCACVLLCSVKKERKKNRMVTSAWPTVTAESQNGLPPIPQLEGLSNYGLLWYMMELYIIDDDL